VDPVATLTAIPLFGSLTKDQAQNLISASRVRRYLKDAPIVKEGDPGHSMFVILQGRVEVSRLDAQGDRVIFHEIGEGEFFGEMSLLAGIRRTADVTAVESCKLLVIEETAFVRCVLASPEVAMRVISHLCHRLIQSDNARIASRPVRYRLVQALLDLSDDAGVVEISKAALGRRILARRETVSRELTRLAKEGYITQTSKRIALSDPHRLRAILEGQR